jgi:orotate phosphoribosyltransferase
LLGKCGCTAGCPRRITTSQIVHAAAPPASEALCIVDREEGGAENLAKHGLRMSALFTADELRAAATS